MIYFRIRGEHLNRTQIAYNKNRRAPFIIYYYTNYNTYLTLSSCYYYYYYRNEIPFD